MATFPRTNPEMMELAGEMIEGFKKNPGIFPSPTITIPILEASLGILQTKHDARIEFAGRLKQLAEDEDKAALDLEQKMRADLLYAESVTKTDPIKLELIGWSPRKQAKPIKPPGQAANLEANKIAANTVQLTWKSSSKGGRAAFYKIQYRIDPDGPWLVADSAADNKIVLVNQPEDREIEYRVIAANKSGQAPPSNTITITL